jgi:hypothetical protein
MVLKMKIGIKITAENLLNSLQGSILKNSQKLSSRLFRKIDYMKIWPNFSGRKFYWIGPQEGERGRVRALELSGGRFRNAHLQAGPTPQIPHGNKTII